MSRDQQLTRMRQQDLLHEMQSRVWRDQVRHQPRRPVRLLRVLRLQRP